MNYAFYNVLKTSLRIHTGPLTTYYFYKEHANLHFRVIPQKEKLQSPCTNKSLSPIVQSDWTAHLLVWRFVEITWTIYNYNCVFWFTIETLCTIQMQIQLINMQEGESQLDEKSQNEGVFCPVDDNRDTFSASRKPNRNLNKHLRHESKFIHSDMMTWDYIYFWVLFSFFLSSI